MMRLELHFYKSNVIVVGKINCNGNELEAGRRGRKSPQ